MPDDDDQKPIADDLLDPDAELDGGVLSADHMIEKELAGTTSTKLNLDEVDDSDVVDIDDEEEETPDSDDDM
ncbi:MAG: hypothetical protein JWL80_153 [Parcubacteria group bacterium]|nr:hypothetical protein [Parcubacteria group bacterium]